MEHKRVFRSDYKPLNQPYKFNEGEVAIFTDFEKPNIKIKVREVEYTLPFRDFMVSTRVAIN